MFYDDETRRFNLLSGLVLGAVLGTGLALLAAPQGRRKLSRKSRDYGTALKAAVERAAKKGVPGRASARGGSAAGKLRTKIRRAVS